MGGVFCCLKASSPSALPDTLSPAVGCIVVARQRSYFTCCIAEADQATATAGDMSFVTVAVKGQLNTQGTGEHGFVSNDSFAAENSLGL